MRECMYLIDRDLNRISNIKNKTFSELGFKERAHLQEWIAHNPECLGEELLIIQKEFCGFDETNERLDLLALDKSGNLVIIENKLDDTGKDVTWQSLKYASYCSSLTKNQIREIYQQFLDKEGINEKAEENLINFFNDDDYEEIELNVGQTQRIILVAGNFRKEVTSTVLWLLNYRIKIQCIKATPYQLHEQIFLDLNQIIPVKEVEDYTIKMAEKSVEENIVKNESQNRHNIRFEFWNELLNEIKKEDQFVLFNNISASKDGWIGASSGISNISYNFVISKDYARVELYFSNPKVEINKFLFDKIIIQKEKIEKLFEKQITWERLDSKKGCRIKSQLSNVNLYNREDWNKMIKFMISEMISFEKTFKDPLKEVKILLKEQNL